MNQEKLAATQQLANRYEKELDGERTFRKELELKLQVLNTETESKIRECLNFNTKLEDQLLTISGKIDKLYPLFKFISKNNNKRA